MVSKLPRQLIAFIVDEEHILASTLAQFLRREGLDARSFAGPIEALDAASRLSPDLLISDAALSLSQASNWGTRCEHSVRPAKC